jgi:hypothetical protein
MKIDLAGRRALVTGSTSGIGYRINRIQSARRTTSVCAGAFLLAEAGLPSLECMKSSRSSPELAPRTPNPPFAGGQEGNSRP